MTNGLAPLVAVPLCRHAFEYILSMYVLYIDVLKVTFMHLVLQVF